MRRWQKIALGILIGIIGLFGFLVLYKIRYSMEVARSFEVNDPMLKQRILIATQGSEYKDAVVQGIVEKFKSRPVYIHVVDISALPTVEESPWNAIVIIHTWENWQPPNVVSDFVQQTKYPDRLILLTTSGDGGFTMDDTDAITSASLLDDVPTHVEEITMRLDKLLE